MNARKNGTKSRAKKRPRVIRFSRDDVRLTAKQLAQVANEYSAFADQLDAVKFDGELRVDGGQQVEDSVKALTYLLGVLTGRFGSEQTPQIGTPEILPETVPEKALNTRTKPGTRPTSSGNRSGPEG